MSSPPPTAGLPARVAAKPSLNLLDFDGDSSAPPMPLHQPPQQPPAPGSEHVCRNPGNQRLGGQRHGYTCIAFAPTSGLIAQLCIAKQPAAPVGVHASLYVGMLVRSGCA